MKGVWFEEGLGKAACGECECEGRSEESIAAFEGSRDERGGEAVYLEGEFIAGACELLAFRPIGCGGALLKTESNSVFTLRESLWLPCLNREVWTGPRRSLSPISKVGLRLPPGPRECL